MKITWTSPEETGKDNFDLCGKFNGKYVDIVHRPKANTWSVYYDNETIKEGVATRDEAKRIAIQRLEKPNAPQISFTIKLTEQEGRGWAYSVDCDLGLCAIGYGVDPVDAAKMATRQLNKSIKYMAKEAQKKLASN
jgi:hypothetical protein